MSLGIPNDYDDAQPDKSSDETAVMDGTEDEETGTEKSAAEHRQELDEAIDELRRGLEANASVIREKADITEVETVHERLTALEERLTDLEDNHQVMHDYLLDLEEYRREKPEPSAEEVAAINPLSAAVFDDKPECPDCDDGKLALRTSFTGRYVVCSGENCEYKQKIARV